MEGKPPGMSNIMKMCNNIFSELMGDYWSKNASRNITSQVLGACLAYVPHSKRCVSAQRFCSVTISLKSTGSAAAVVATVPVDCGWGWERKSATTFFKPGRYKSCTLNSEMNANGVVVWVKWGLKYVTRQ
jgi:hypothetical protein